MQNVGKYGKRTWEKTFEPIVENFKVLKNLSDTGAEIIFITAREEKYLNQFKKTLSELGVHNCNLKSVDDGSGTGALLAAAAAMLVKPKAKL